MVLVDGAAREVPATRTRTTAAAPIRRVSITVRSSRYLVEISDRCSLRKLRSAAQSRTAEIPT
jgi:hypothetical protein